MDFDSNNKTLRPIYDKLDSLIDKGYDLSYVFKDIIFRGCNQFDRDYSRVPCWVRDAGNTAECGWTKEEFETYVRNNYEDYEIVHRWLYYYDCDMLVCALCDRFKMIASMLRVFYCHFPSESLCKMEDFKHATIAVSSHDTICFACVNSIFLYLASSFDILSKIYVEFRDHEKLDFSKYPNMISRKVLLGSIGKTNSDIAGTLFEKPLCVKTISSINKGKYEEIDGTQYLTYNYTPLISIGKNEYYLQSKNFSDTSTSKTGVKLDLNSGKLYGYDFLIQAGQGDKKLIIDSDSTKPLTIGTNFKVDWDGKIEATEGKFSGKITASSGNIGGWTIVKNALYKNTSGNIKESTEEGNKNKLIKYKAVSGSAIIAPSADVTISDLTAFKVWEYTSGDSTQNTPGGSDGPTITTTTEGTWSQSAATASNIVFSVGKNFAINKAFLFVEKLTKGGFLPGPNY